MQETLIIGGREFTCVRMNPFAANKILMRLQKVAVPVIGSFLSTGKNIGDVDVKVAAQALSEHLDESLMDSVVFPMFSDSKTYCVEAKKFIKSGLDVDQCFKTENLFDFYELIFEVARYQFGPFFGSLVARFGSQAAAGVTAKVSLES